MSWVNDKRKDITNDVVDAVQDVGEWLNDEVVDPITDALGNPITDKLEDVWKEDIRPWTSEVLTIVGHSMGGPLGSVIGSTVGELIEGGNSDDAVDAAKRGGIAGVTMGTLDYLGDALGAAGEGAAAGSAEAAVSNTSGLQRLGGKLLDATGSLGDAAVDTYLNVAEMIPAGVKDVFDSVVGTAGDFITAPLDWANEHMPDMVREVGGDLWDTASGLISKLPEGAGNLILGILKGGGAAAKELLGAIQGGASESDLLNILGGGAGGGGLLESLGSIYANERAGREQAEAIRYATDAQTEAARESMQLQRDLAERGFDLQERGTRLGGPWREAGMGALNELNQLYGLGGLSNAVDPYTGEVVVGGAPTLSREASQQAARDRFKTSPGYEFRRDEGLKAIDRLASARGYMGGTRAAREAQRYGEGLASQEYDQYVSRLQNLSGTGDQQVGAGVNALSNSASMASNLGTNLGRTAQAAGDATASGYLTQGAYGADQWNRRSNLFQELV